MKKLRQFLYRLAHKNCDHDFVVIDESKETEEVTYGDSHKATVKVCRCECSKCGTKVWADSVVNIKKIYKRRSGRYPLDLRD